MDVVKDVGTFVEIEGRGTEKERSDIEAKLKDILTKCGIVQKDFVQKGYVALALEAEDCARSMR